MLINDKSKGEITQASWEVVRQKLHCKELKFLSVACKSWTCSESWAYKRLESLIKTEEHIRWGRKENDWFW